MNFDHIRKIAIVRANALGDYIFVIPALQALRERFTQAEIVYLGKEWHKDFLEKRPGPVDRVVVIPHVYGVGCEDKSKENPNEIEDFFQLMAKEKFDLAVQVHGGGKYSNPFTCKLHARLTLGLQTPDAVPLDISVPYIYYQNEILRYLEVVAQVGATTRAISPFIEVTQQDIKDLLKVTDAFSRPPVIIHPGCTDIRRQWPPSHFVTVANELISKSYHVIITGTESEKPLIDEVFAHITGNADNLCGKLSLGALAALLQQSIVVIANDTGPLHLAEAVGASTVGIYWCGNVINAGPMTRKKHRPCISWQIFCPLCGGDCSSLKPFEPQTPQCRHLTSFVKPVTTTDVLDSVYSLIRSPVSED